MSSTDNLKRSQVALKTTQTAETIQFASIFGSNANPKWFEFLMKYAGHYLFTFGLVYAVLKLGLNIYQYSQKPNKNINEQSFIAWSIFHTAILMTAIIGSLVAATVFAIVTPALFVSAMGLDTLRNISNFFWNIGKLISLRFSVHEQLKDDQDPLTRLKYQDLKQQYLAQIKMSGIGSLIGLTLTTAATIIFLFPQIGLASVGAAGVVIAGVKITVGATVGVAASLALILPLMPLVKSLGSWIASKIMAKKNITTEPRQTTDHTPAHEKNSQLEEQEKNSFVIIQPKKEPTFVIRTEAELTTALQHDLNFSALTVHKRYRETILDHIEEQSLARKALETMVDEKIEELRGQILQGKTGGYRFFAEQQRPKREQKLHAMLLIKQQLKVDHQNVFEPFTAVFKNFSLIEQQIFPNLTALLGYIENNLPGVSVSYFLDQSDTQNILAAAQVFAQKFPERKQSNDLVA